jgi:hypothetical protein
MTQNHFSEPTGLGFIIKSSRSKANCEVIYKIYFKILKSTLCYRHYITTIVLLNYELISEDKCTFIFTKFTKFTNYVIEYTYYEKSFS